MSPQPAHPLWHLDENEQGMDVESIRRSFAGHVEYTQARDEYSASRMDFFLSLARTARDRMMDRWNRTQQASYHRDARRVYYLSLEYLLGRLLDDALLNLGIREPAREALAAFGLELDSILPFETDAGLGNGGLGRLAACFLDSMATLGIPATGYGIRYEYGIFRQHVRGGEQVEGPDNWLRYGNPWEVPRPDVLFPVRFGGHVETWEDEAGRLVFAWQDCQVVMAMAYDMLVPGYQNGVVNTLRLWAAKASREFDFANFNKGDYVEAVYEKNATENISRVLYPNDKTQQGRELRLRQEYFFVSATLQDAIRRHLKLHPTVRNLHEKAVFQLNDTHPALAVAELMRLLVDEHQLGWEEAWNVTSRCFAYTNHTILPEALETWPVPMLERLLPRHLQIIYEINARFLAIVAARFPEDPARLARCSLVAEGHTKHVRMAHLAVVGSFSVNGVSELHSQLLRDTLFRDFAELWPERFQSKTNGITPRRWLLTCNPTLAGLISSAIGPDWVTDLDRLAALAPLADDPAFRAAWRAARLENKRRLIRHVRREMGLVLDPDHLFDVQVKRIHEYKRQLLLLLHVIATWRRYKREGTAGAAPRVSLMGGKAAPGYELARRIIRLATSVAEVVNQDPETNQVLKFLFLPDYRVSLAEVIIPAADLSEQISTAGTEASGTGNMKLSLNGALTLGTLDGANIEIREAVGPENFFTFGMDEPAVRALRARGYDPFQVVASTPDLQDALDCLANGTFSKGDRHLHRALLESLLQRGDPFLVCADFMSYGAAWRSVEQAWADPDRWTRMSILTTAHMGRFSSDRTIAAYATGIWGVCPSTERPSAVR